MSEMVNRVARAICTSMVPGCDDPCSNKGGCVYLDEARAAIAAMREPDLDMRMAGAYAGKWSGNIEGILSDEKNAAEEVYEAMIDEALK